MGLFFGLPDGIADMIKALVQEIAEKCVDTQNRAMCIMCCGLVSALHNIIGMAELVTGIGLTYASAQLGQPWAAVGGIFIAYQGIITMADSFESFEVCREGCRNCEVPLP